MQRRIHSICPDPHGAQAEEMSGLLRAAACGPRLCLFRFTTVSGVSTPGMAVVVFFFVGGDRLVVWLALADLTIRHLAPEGEA
jgi:hypothetical protein